MISAYLTKKNKPKMSCVAPIEAEIRVGPHGSSQEGYPIGSEGPFLASIPTYYAQMNFKIYLRASLSKIRAQVELCTSKES